MTLCPSGLRGWTQVPLARAAWVQIPQVSVLLGSEEVNRFWKNVKIQTENEREGGIMVPEGLEFFCFEDRVWKSIERQVEEDRDMPKRERERSK